MKENFVKEAKVFKALSDENRLKLLDYLRGGEKCACKLNEIVDVSQPTLSHHMKILCDSGLVKGRKEGKWMHYSIDQEVSDELQQMLREIFQKREFPEEVQIYGCPGIKKEGRTTEGEEKETMEEMRTKLYILTGFLGSGKTTLLQNVLRTLEGKKIGIIQNELGKLGIDGEILRDDDIKMVEINRGSIFCSCLKLSFVQALAEMSAYDFDYLFVESSGFGDPSNVKEILRAAAQICEKQYDYSGTICLADAVNFEEQIEKEEGVYRQIKHAHAVVITKVDLVDMDVLLRLKQKIREINPVCRIGISSINDLYAEFLQEDLMQFDWAEEEETTNSIETKPKTLFMNFEGEVDREKLEAFLEMIQNDVHRVKGFFRLSNEGWNQIDVVGKLIDYKPCEEKETSQLVFISKIGPTLIKELFHAWEQTVGVPMQLRN